MVNNAQASKSGTNLIDHTKEDFDLAINTGLYGAFFYMKHAFPELKKTKGCVINLASGAGLFGKPGQSSYAAAKEGIRGMTRVAATEWGPDGVRANCICPLAMTEQLAAWKEAYPDTFAATIKGIPLGRFGDPKTDIGRRGRIPRERFVGLRFRRNHHRPGRQRPASVGLAEGTVRSGSRAQDDRGSRLVTSPACATGNAPKPYHSSRYAPRISEAQAFIIHQGEAYVSPFFFLF